MQKIVLSILIVICTSCTIARKEPTTKFGLELFDNITEEQNYVQNKNILIKYTTCRAKWFSDGGKSKEYLREEFKKKYSLVLDGISNLEIERTQILDSSIFVPNEVCFRISGNPVTKTIIKNEKKEEWEIVDPSYHTH